MHWRRLVAVACQAYISAQQTPSDTVSGTVRWPSSLALARLRSLRPAMRTQDPVPSHSTTIWIFTTTSLVARLVRLAQTVQRHVEARLRPGCFAPFVGLRPMLLPHRR